MVKIQLRYTLAGVALIFVATAVTDAAQAETRWPAERGARAKPSLILVAQADTSPTADTPPTKVVRFPVKAASIQGNTLLPQSELTKLVANLLDGERSLEDLNKAAIAVQHAYRNAGYGGVVAFIPEQDLSSGSVIIRVIEGKLARIRISDHQRLDETG